MTRGSLLRSETASRLLAVLAGLPDQELHTNELIRRTASNPNAVQRALGQLERSGILRSRRVGNLRLWQMDRQHPLYASLRDLVMRTSGLPTRLREILARDDGISFAFIFGSFVTAGDAATSDIDIFIAGAANWDRLTDAIRVASDEVGRELRPVVWSLDDLSQPTPAQRAFLQNVLSGPVIWLIGARDEFERHRSMAAAVVERRSASQRERGGRAQSRQGGPRERRTRKKGTR